MGKEKKKGVRGAASNFISRTRAVKKLQVSLADFRKLCILKGIYPRAPTTAALKKLGASTAPRTYYFTKDIQFLLHEPLVNQFRQYKIYLRKLRKANAKGESEAVVKSLEQEWKLQEIGIEHIIKERYPTFSHAVHDLSDALNLVHLFARLPSGSPAKNTGVPIHTQIPSSTIDACKKVCAEFQHMVARRGMVRRCFVSIKGIYYGVDLGGGEAEVVWVVPHEFSVTIPPTVDLRILLTFLQLYTTLLRFVCHKLYTDANLTYPPRIVDRDGDGGERWAAESVEAGERWEGDAVIKAIGERLEEKAKEGVEGEGNADEGMDTTETVAPTAVEKDLATRLATIPTKLATLTQTAAADVEPADISAARAVSAETTVDRPLGIPEGLFTPYHFFLSRETPVPSLLFVLRSHGARHVTVDHPTSPYALHPYSSRSGTPEITHHVTDRPLRHTVFGRNYVQPQWVYDSVNAGKVMDEWAYRAAEDVVLPPHASPWGRSAEDLEKDNRGVSFAEREEGVADEEEEEEEAEGEEAGDGKEDEEVAPVDPNMQIEGSDVELENGEGADEEGDESVGEDETDSEVETVVAKGAGKKEAPKQQPKKAATNGTAKFVSKLPSLNAENLAPSHISDPTIVRALELEAESLGMTSTEFTAELARAGAHASGGKNSRGGRKGRASEASRKKDDEEREKTEMRKAMMSKRDRKLYERMMFGIEKKKEEERKLAARRLEIQKADRAKEKAEAKAKVVLATSEIGKKRARGEGEVVFGAGKKQKVVVKTGKGKATWEVIDG